MVGYVKLGKFAKQGKLHVHIYKCIYMYVFVFARFDFNAFYLMERKHETGLHRCLVMYYLNKYVKKLFKPVLSIWNEKDEIEKVVREQYDFEKKSRHFWTENYLCIYVSLWIDTLWNDTWRIDTRSLTPKLEASQCMK